MSVPRSRGKESALIFLVPSTPSEPHLRKHGLAPLLTSFYCLFRKGLVLDGTAGRYYTPERTYAEAWRYASLTGASAGVSEGERSSVAR